MRLSTEVPGELWMAVHCRHWTRAKAFVRHRKIRSRAQQECGDQLQRKRIGVIVVDEDGDIGFKLREPFARRDGAVEVWFPVLVACVALVERGADGRNM
jgi:hypothetical protein